MSCALWLAASHTANCVPPDMSDLALRSMCERGLAESAAQYCRAQADLFIENAPNRARWTMRLMECQSQSALRSSGQATAAKWQQVEQTENQYRREFADDPRLPWLAWQLARTELLRSQQALARWLATPAATAERDQALLSVRKVNSLVDALEQDLKVRLPLSNNRSGTPTQVASRELQELQQDCSLLRCESYLIRAKCYPLESPDHLAALAEVDSTVASVMRAAAADWPARDELMVAGAIAGLEVGKRRESIDLLIKTLVGPYESEVEPGGASLPSYPPSDLARLRAGSALVETLCIEGKPDEAAEFVRVLVANFSGPEVDLARLRVAIAKMKQLPAADRAAALASIVADTKSIGQQYGNYWRNRSEALLVAEAGSESTSSSARTTANDSKKPNGSTTSTTTSTTNSQPSPAAPMNELLAIEVRQLLAGGQTVAAITKLRSAVTAAESAQRYAEATGYALEAARLMQKEQQWLEAAELVAPLASQHPEVENAAAAHALAAWCVAQTLKSSATQANEKLYEELLNTQLTKWPESTETVKCVEYLSAWLTSKKRYDELATMWLDRLLTVSNEDRQRMALDQWLGTLLARVPKANVPAQIAQLSKQIINNKVTTAGRSASITVIAAAMLTMPLARSEAEEMTGCRLPEHAMQQPAGDEVLLSALLMLDAVYRNSPGDAHNAAESLELAQLTSTVNLAWCRAMALAAEELPPTQVSNWSNLFKRVQLPADQSMLSSPALKVMKLRLEQLSAESESDSNAALDKIKQLTDTQATDASLQLTKAAAIVQARQAASQDARFKEATQIVKRVAVGTKKDSEVHLRARWLEIQWQLGRGDKAAAASIAQLMTSQNQLPAWWQARFQKVVSGKE